jgi:hypothetical protein
MSEMTLDHSPTKLRDVKPHTSENATRIESDVEKPQIQKQATLAKRHDTKIDQRRGTLSERYPVKALPGTEAAASLA